MKSQPPALSLALQVSRSAVALGFEWEHLEQVWDKVHEEIDELREAIAEENHSKQMEELGDLLFSIVNIGRWLGIDSEEALHKMLHKFQHRFDRTQQLAVLDGRKLEDCTLDEMEAYWQKAKLEERTPSEKS